MNAKGFKEKTEGTVFKGEQMQVLRKAPIWLGFHLVGFFLGFLCVLFVGGQLEMGRKFQEYLKVKIVSAGTFTRCVLHIHELFIQSQNLQKWFNN